MLHFSHGQATPSFTERCHPANIPSLHRGPTRNHTPAVLSFASDILTHIPPQPPHTSTGHTDASTPDPQTRAGTTSTTPQLWFPLKYTVTKTTPLPHPILPCLPDRSHLSGSTLCIKCHSSHSTPDLLGRLTLFVEVGEYWLLFGNFYKHS